MRDGAGIPIVDNKGRYVTDPTAPRLIAWQNDGVIWDVGVLWRPSPRTSLEARYGRRYGSDTYYGSFSYQPGRDWAANVSVYDTVSGFGGMINDSLSNLPTQFRSTRNPLSGDIGSCAFSATGGSQCLNDALGTASGAAFRQRGITASFAGTSGGWDTGFAVGYSHRKFLTSNLGAQSVLYRTADENYFAVASLGRTLDERTRFDTNVYVNYFDPGYSGTNVLSTGANAALYRQIIRGLTASAAVGLDAYRPDNFDSELTASALLGLRYSFR